jgi:biopolymer transport protein TolR
MPKADINVTPLIDVLLVLLILFMLMVKVAPLALDASLPARADASASAATLVLEVNPDGFRLNRVPVLTLRELDERLRAAFALRRDAAVFIQPTGRLNCGRVVEAIDAAKGAGASRVGLVDATHP